MRSDRETIVDRLLLLYAVEQANKYGRMEGTFKLQKIPFVSELSMNQEGVKGFSYTFFKYTHGPMTKQIYEDGGILHTTGFITSLKGPIYLTDHGANLLRSTESIRHDNAAIFRYIESAAQTYASLSFTRLKKKVYDLSVGWYGEDWKISEIPAYTDVLSKLEDAEASLLFQIDDDWIDSLWGALHYSEEESKKLKVVHRVAI